LRDLGATVIAHDDQFAPTTPDEVWLERCGREGWIVLTKDRNIRHNILERTALLRSGVRAFVLVSGNLTGAEIITAFTRALPRIQKLAVEVPAPFIGKVSRSGSAAVWLSEELS